MIRYACRILISVVLLALVAGPADASWDNWNCNLQAYWGAVGGSPSNVRCYFGVGADATDERDSRDLILHLCPGYAAVGAGAGFYGQDVFAWFNRPTWGLPSCMYPIGDYRSPVAEDTSKRWGTGLLDTWNVITDLDNGPSGVFDQCGYQLEYPVAASICFTWEFGISPFPPTPDPPEDYTFTLIYAGGINPKPAGTKLPDAMAPPAVGASWDMEATPHIVLPLWRYGFQPLREDCQSFAPTDTAKFYIMVHNPPGALPTCAIDVEPPAPLAAPATFTLIASATGDEPFTYSWDFGDGASGGGSPVSHTYLTQGIYTATCLATGSDGDTASCTAAVQVMAPCQPPASCFTYAPSPPTIADPVQFTDCSTQEPPCSIVTWAWDFGDGGTSSEPNPSHQYAAGTHRVSLTVTNDRLPPQTATAAQTIRVLAPPHCRVSYSPEAPLPGDRVRFVCQAVDPDGGTVTAAWDFGDGAGATGLTTSHYYAAPGTYTVVCTVTDDEGDTAACETAVPVYPRPPTACFTTSADLPQPGEAIEFDASCTAAGSGPVVAYDWGFGDGETDSGAVASHSYQVAGGYEVYLTVIDGNDLTDTATEMVYVGMSEADMDWDCNLKAYRGAIGGAPMDVQDLFGVKPGATDGWDLGIDARKPGEPFGDLVYAWFNRPAWETGPIMYDWRSPIAEGTSKVWGTGFLDTWNVKTTKDNGPSGVFDHCGWGFELPIAASIYLTWEFGAAQTPPGPLPPEDYTFTLQYRGGIDPKPPGTALPDAAVPPLNQTWDMEATSQLVVPLWRVNYEPANAACDDLAAGDTAKFKILVVHPRSAPACTIAVEPAAEQPVPATFTFAADAVGQGPLTYSWDFGDGTADVGSPVSHTYTTIGTQTVICTVTDVDGDTGACTATVEVTPVTLCFDVIGDCRNMITLPGELVSTDPWEVFDELRPPNKSVDLLSGNLHRYDNELRAYVAYYRWTPAQFGPIVPGEGYWLWAFYDETICYDALPWPGAQGRDLPGVGWYLAGSPHGADCYLDDTLWSHGAEGPYLFSAIMNLWVQDPLFNWSCSWGGYRTCGLLPIDNDHYLPAFLGYWLYAFVDDVTMVVPPP